LELVENAEINEIHKQIIENPIISFDTDHPFGFHSNYIAWRTTIWNFAVHRSLEIWNKLPVTKIENSLGSLSEFARKSLKGKLGAHNGKSFKKDENSIWTHLQFKQTSADKAFKSFSHKAIETCKKRARTK